MALILNIETSSENCSVGLAQDGEMLALKEEQREKYIHSEKLHPFIEEVLKTADKKLSDLDAVAVDKGPGSYTGLRIGVSAAKGFAYPLNIPIISATALEILSIQFAAKHNVDAGDLLVPMIDARRMEVYTAIFSHRLTPISMIEARVIDDSGLDHLEGEHVYVFGTGAEKCKSVLSHPKFIFEGPVYPSATGLAIISERKFKEAKFENTAYFEPFYLKEFVAGKPKPLL